MQPGDKPDYKLNVKTLPTVLFGMSEGVPITAERRVESQNQATTDLIVGERHNPSCFNNQARALIGHRADEFNRSRRRRHRHEQG